MITLKIEGSDKLLAALQKAASPTERQDLLDQIGAYGVSSTQERFIKKAGPGGEAWKPSRRAEAGGQTLRNTGRLFQSFSHLVTTASVAWGTNVVYAGIHQFGGDIKAKAGGKLRFRGFGGGFVYVDKVTIPARPFLGLNAEDRTEIHQIAADWFGAVFQ